MSTASLRARVAKLEKRERRYSGGEPTTIEVARRIGYCLSCAAYQYGTEESREYGRRLAIMFGRNRARSGREMSPKLTDMLLRALVGEVSVTDETPV